MMRSVIDATAFANSGGRDDRKKTRSAMSDVRPWRSLLPRKHISRPGLCNTLDAALTKKLTLIAAPAGSGKSVLLAQWAERRHAGLTLRWLALSKLDDDASRLRIRLQSIPIDTAVVIVDDVHFLQCEQAASELAEFIHSTSRDMHWIVSGRGVPDLRRSELAIRDELLCIDAARLPVDTAFIQQFARACGSSRSDVSADRVFEETEGWLAGVKLALLPQEEKPTAASECFADAYFSNLLQSLPQSLRDAVLTYSIPDTITPALAVALAEGMTEDRIASFRRVEGAQLFLKRTNSSTDEFRFNRQFHIFLRSRASAQLSNLSHLHRAASRWFLDRQRFHEALEHAGCTGDSEWRLNVLASALPHFLRSGAIETVLHWSQALDPSVLFARDSVWTAHIAALILARRFYAAAQALDAARDRALILCNATKEKLATLKLMLELLSGRAKEIGTDALHGEHYLTGTLLNLRAYKLLQGRHFDAARRCAYQAREMLLEQESLYGATHANAVLCAALSRLARYEECRDECERMFAAFPREARDTAWANAAIALAHIRYEQNRLPEANQLCADALPLLSNVASLHCYTACRCLMARIRSAMGYREDGWRMLDELHGYLEACEARHLLVQLASEKLIHSAQHCPETMARVAAEFALDDVEVRWVKTEPCELGDASDLALLGYAQVLRLVRLAELSRALALIQALMSDAQQHTDVHRLILLEALQSIVYERLGDHDATHEAILRALAHARGAGFTRSVFDEIPEFASFFSAKVRSGHIDSVLPRRYVERFADVLGLNSDLRGIPACASNGYAVEALTHREADILKLLAQGLSNQEICMSTRIAMTTTKWHLKNIFAKLNVRTRTAALARARALELIK